MNLRDVLSQDMVSLELKATTKEGIIHELLDMIDAHGTIKDREAAERDVMKRENELSTGLANGIAFPHAKTSAVDRLSVAIGLKKEGIEFEALDGEPSEVFILSLIPIDENDQYLAFLAAVNMRLTDPDVRDKLKNQKKAAKVVKLLAADPA
jgi:fructose-specific phosphotransferase system IIA component